MSEQQNNYQPIACGLHSTYELAIMHRQPLQLTWHDENNDVMHMQLIPIDITTRDHAEFLLARDKNNTVHEIRLDKIIHSDLQQTGKN